MKNQKLEQDQEYQLKKIKKPRYIKIQGTKILTPKDIVGFDIGTDSYVFGDPRCAKHMMFKREVIDTLYHEKKVLIVLRTTKKEKTKCFAFTANKEQIESCRKWRLANVLNLYKIALAQKSDEAQTPEAFMMQELGIEEEMDKDKLQEQFINSMKKELLIKDVVRIVQLYYQDKGNGKKRVQPKKSSGAN